MYTLQFSWLWPNLPALLNGALVPVILTVAVCLVGSMIGTAERAKSINFTNPYGANVLVVAGRSNIEVKDATGLAGKSIAVVRGTIQDTDLTQQIAKTIIELDPSKSLEEKFITRVSPFSIGLRRGDADFLHLLNTLLYTHRLNGDLDAIHEKWIGGKRSALPTF